MREKYGGREGGKKERRKEKEKDSNLKPERDGKMSE